MSAAHTFTIGDSTNVPALGGYELSVFAPITGAFALTKDQTGSGTQVLTGASIYSGGITVSGGTLEIDNTSGSGTIAGSTILNSGTVLAPGTGSTATSNQTLTFTAFTSTLTVNDGARIELGVTAPTTQALGIFYDGVYHDGLGGTATTALAYLKGIGSSRLSAWNSHSRQPCFHQSRRRIFIPGCRRGHHNPDRQRLLHIGASARRCVRSHRLLHLHRQLQCHHRLQPS